MSDLAAAALDRQIHEFCAAHYADPLGFVLGAYRWPIHGMAGPDRWQAEVLEELGRAIRARRYDGVTSVAPIRKAISAGYGVGKTALIGWVCNFLMSTRPHCRGTVTANTNDQLQLKTWAAVIEWTQRCLTREWF